MVARRQQGNMFLSLDDGHEVVGSVVVDFGLIENILDLALRLNYY